MSARSGDSPTPDGTWTVWTPVSVPGSTNAGTGRYAQYRAELSTTDLARTPVLRDVTLGTSAPADHTLTVTAPLHGTITSADTFINCGTGGTACTRTYDYGTAVTLTATPDVGYSFTAWSGACTGTGTCPLAMTADRAVGATFTINTHTLTVTAPLHGTITSADTFINCGTGGTACTRTYNYGTAVTLTATPDVGYSFTAWSGSCAGTGTCPLAMTANRAVGATFTINTHTLTVTAPLHGTITSADTFINCGTGGTACTRTYNYGTAVTLTATPDVGYSFTAWSGACAGTGTCPLAMTANRAVGATFTINTHTLTVTAPLHGTITSADTFINCGTGGTACTRTYDYGTAVTLTATPDVGYSFTAWSGACAGTGTCPLAMTANRAVGATFTINTHTLTVTAPLHGTITSADTFINCGTGGTACTRTYNYGTAVTLTATPDVGYSFTAWSGACAGTGTCPLAMTANRAVGATFTINTHTLTVTAPLHGTITSADTFINCGTGGTACTRTYDYGTAVTLTATPDVGYSFTAWSGACAGTGTCPLAMTANRAVGATFVRIIHTLTVTAPLHGTITSADTFINCGTGGTACTRTYDYGTAVTLTATPDVGYSFTAWSGACSGSGTCPLTMTADRAVSATFTIQQFTLTVAPTANGTITGAGINCNPDGIDCSETYDYGTVVALTATPHTLYDFVAWTGACTGTAPCEVTINAAKTVTASFAIQHFDLTVTPPVNGTITGLGIDCGPAGPDCTETYEYATLTLVPLTATPAPGYDFSSWNGACTGTGPCALEMATAQTVGATFTLRQSALAVAAPVAPPAVAPTPHPIVEPVSPLHAGETPVPFNAVGGRDSGGTPEPSTTTPTIVHVFADIPPCTVVTDDAPPTVVDDKTDAVPPTAVDDEPDAVPLAAVDDEDEAAPGRQQVKVGEPQARGSGACR